MRSGRLLASRKYVGRFKRRDVREEDGEGEGRWRRRRSLEGRAEQVWMTGGGGWMDRWLAGREAVPRPPHQS